MSLVVLAGIVVVGVVVGVVVLNEKQPATKTIDIPQTQVYSSIRLADFVPPHVLPKKADSMPEVEEMTWEFADFQGDTHVVELYLALSRAEYDIIEREGLYEDALEEIPLFDEAAIAKVLGAQQKEIEAAGEDKEKIAGLRVEHRDQLKIIKEQTWARTIEYYLQRPYVQEFETRARARHYRDDLTDKILPAFRKKLEKYGKH